MVSTPPSSPSSTNTTSISASINHPHNHPQYHNIYTTSTSVSKSLYFILLFTMIISSTMISLYVSTMHNITTTSMNYSFLSNIISIKNFQENTSTNSPNLVSSTPIMRRTSTITTTTTTTSTTDDTAMILSSLTHPFQQHQMRQQRQLLQQEQPQPLPSLNQENKKKKKNMKSKIIVTGGGGFVGSHIVEYLLLHHYNEYDIIIIDEMNDYYDISIKESNLNHLIQLHKQQQQRREEFRANKNKNTKQRKDEEDEDDSDAVSQLYIYRGDICNTTLLDIIFNEHGDTIVSICHMAARAGVRPSILNPFVYIHSNIIGTITLYNYALRYSNIQNFVFASSSSVYGGSKSMYFTENEVVDYPISPYAATKKACELFAYVYSYLYNMNTTALRFFTVYGPRGRPDMAPYKFIHSISNHIPIQQYGDGTSSRDYTYISDIVQGVISALLFHPTQYRVYNLGKGSGTTLNEFVHYVEQYVNTSAIVQVLPNQMGDVPYTCANITLAQQYLHYQPQISFPKGIQQTVKWYQNYTTAASTKEQLSTSKKERETTTRTTNKRIGDGTRRQLSSKQEQHIPRNHRRRLVQSQGRNVESSNTNDIQIVPRQDGYKKVVVSGGVSTFVGSYVVEALLQRGDDVIVIDDDYNNDDTININIYDPKLPYHHKFHMDRTNQHETLQYLNEKYIKQNTKKNQNKYNNKMGKLTIYLGNRCNTTFLEMIFHKEQPQWVYHYGIDTPLNYDNYNNNNNENIRNKMENELEISKLYVQYNIEILVRLLEVSKSGSTLSPSLSNGKKDTLILNKSIQNFVFTSSDSVYGTDGMTSNNNSNNINFMKRSDRKSIAFTMRNETDRVDNPKSSHGASMKSAELIGYTYHHLYNIPVSILRLFSVYGPKQPVSSVSHQLFDLLLQSTTNDTINKLDPDTNNQLPDLSTLDYTYIDDIVQGILSSIDRPYNYEIFNLGSNNCPTGIYDIINALSEQLSLNDDYIHVMTNRIETMIFQHQSKNSVDGICCANIQKAQQLLQYNPTNDVRRTNHIQRTIEWHQEKYSGASSMNIKNDDANVNNQKVSKEERPKVPNVLQAPIVKTNTNDELVLHINHTEIPDNTTTNTTKLCTKTEIVVMLTNTSNFPSWLSQFAYMQWCIMVFLLFLRIYFRHCSNLNRCIQLPLTTTSTCTTPQHSQTEATQQPLSNNDQKNNLYHPHT